LLGALDLWQRANLQGGVGPQQPPALPLDDLIEAPARASAEQTTASRRNPLA
jgi:hypothetical protein